MVRGVENSPGALQFAPEYPSLTSEERAEGATQRLAKSKRRFDASSNSKAETLESIIAVLGHSGPFERASNFEMNKWMDGWRMPAEGTRPDNESSASVYVGLKESPEMPEVSRLHPGPPFVTITSRFVETCLRVADLFSTFAVLIGGDPSPELLSAARRMPHEYLDFSHEPSGLVLDTITRTKDDLFSLRTSQSAVRWAIAHEMAHAVASRSERRAAYERAQEIVPDLEEIWSPLRAKLPSFQASIANYQDEIACDLIANQYVLNSPFGRDDLMTQVSGSLAALEALIWDGWFRDASSVSETHPSPTLRFILLWRDWFETLCDEQTWADAKPLGVLGVQDFAHWFAFEEWAAGSYGAARRGPAWKDDIAWAAESVHDRTEVVWDNLYARTRAGVQRLEFDA